jgi:four helix bundle suffix protein
MSSLIGKSGAYRKLKSFQTARLVYDCTVAFCNKYFDKRNRTHDQMVQAARSGVQNIAEGSKASGTSKKFEIKLTNVARASLEELLLDYEDFLRQRSLPLWNKDDPRCRRIRSARLTTLYDFRKLWSEPSDWSDMSETSNLERLRQERGANAVICLIQQASYLLGRQLQHLEVKFLKEGGFTEKMYKMRKRQ